MKYGPLQPHSGAAIAVLYYYLKHPNYHFFDVRMKDVGEKVYRVELAGRTKNELIFRIGKTWACYTKIYLVSGSALNNEAGKEIRISGEFRIDHHHTSVREEFNIDGRKLFSGELRSEAGISVSFEGEFIDDKKMWLIEEFASEYGKVYLRRDYEIEQAW